jgi:hypothetical protein
MRTRTRTRSLENGELLSFLLTVATMLFSSLFFRPFYWVFILFALFDGLATLYKYGLVLSINRIAFAFIVLLLSAVSLGVDVLAIILETVALIMILDLSSLLRKVSYHSTRDFSTIISSRFHSYLYTLVPATVLSIGLTYLGAASFSAAINSQYAILGVGLASVAVFAIIFLAARKPRPEMLK